MPRPQHNVPHRVKVTPFVASTVQAYVDQYWAVMFSSARTAAVDSARMRHYVNWYCTRCKTVDLDHHVAGRRLVTDLHRFADLHKVDPKLPLLFVNKKFIGGIDQVLQLEGDKKLKDVLQFGFEWNSGTKLLGPLPSAYGDAELFRGKYVGAPVAKPVMQLPKMHPHLGIDSHQ
jgi:glutaredoxin-related protein